MYEGNLNTLKPLSLKLPIKTVITGSGNLLKPRKLIRQLPGKGEVMMLLGTLGADVGRIFECT